MDQPTDTLLKKLNALDRAAAQTLKVFPRPGEFIITDFDGFYCNGNRDISKEEFDKLTADPHAIVITVKFNRPRQVVHAAEGGVA